MPYLVEAVVDPSRLAGPQPDIVFGELTLRRWVPSDAGQLMAAYSDSDIRRWALRGLDSLDEADQLITLWKRGWRRHIAASWAVVRRDTPSRVLGQVGFRSLYPADGMAEVSYWVMPSQRRQGVATAATRGLAEWAISILGLQRLELVHSVQNQGSCRVALNAGFEIEGVKRQLQRHQDDFHDMCLHSRIAGLASPPSWHPSVKPLPPMARRGSATND
jgi:RimJ/RimL family protein N-acetyltransferase